jgi:hypothetical protein
VQSEPAWLRRLKPSDAPEEGIAPGAVTPDAEKLSSKSGTQPTVRREPELLRLLDEVGRKGSYNLEDVAELAGFAQDHEDRQLDRKLRKTFAYTMLWIHGVVTVVVMAIVIFVAAGRAALSDKVLMSLIGSTVAELTGLVLAVAKYLFPPPSRPSAAKRSRAAKPKDQPKPAGSR